MPPSISVIIPALNEEHSIGDVLRALGSETEVIVVDGGSTDGTKVVAEQLGAKVVHGPRGRGSQMQLGAELASGEILWFLHADTIPCPDAARAIVEAFNDKDVVAGNFTIVFDDDSRQARFLTWLYPKLRLLGLIYGDSGIFVRRDAYQRVGGFRSYPIFEDLDLVTRLKREGRLVTLSEQVRTSSRRFRDRSFTATFAKWIFLQLLYWAGVSPKRLGQMYFSKETK